MRVSAREWGRRLFDGELPPLLRTVVLVAWATVTLIVVLAHEPWRDEADPWLFARDHDGGLGSLRAYTSGCGSPALWHGLLMLLAKAGLPYGSMGVLHWALAAATMWLLVWRSPLPPVLRVVLPFGFLFGYEYVVVARSYVLTNLLLLLSAALHAHRRERPLAAGLVIGLLANTNAHGFFLAFALGLAFAAHVAAERTPRRLAGVGLALALGLVALWQLWPRPDGQALTPPGSSAFKLLVTLTDGLFPIVPGAPDPIAAGGVVAALLAMLSSAAIVALVVRGVSAPGVRASLLVGLGALFCIFAFKYLGAVRHHGLVQAVLLWAMWADRAAAPPCEVSRRRLRVAAALWALATLSSIPAAVDCWGRDLREPFSGSRAAAQFLRANGLDGGTIAAHPPNEALAVLPYLRARKLWYVGLDAHGSHMSWDARYSAAQRLPMEEAAARTARTCPAGTILIAGIALPDPSRLGFTLVHRSPMVFRYSEVYWVYRLDRPARD